MLIKDTKIIRQNRFFKSKFVISLFNGLEPWNTPHASLRPGEDYAKIRRNARMLFEEKKNKHNTTEQLD